MKKLIAKILLRFITRAELRALVLSAEERRVVASLRSPARWMPDVPLTAQEVQMWAAHLKGGLMLKIDVAMINMAHQHAQNAVHAPASETIRMAGFAAGFRASWEVAKSISTLTGADAGEPEDDDHTASAGLDQHKP